MGNLWEAAKRFRAELLRRDREAAADLVQAYGEAWTSIRARLERLTGQIGEEQAAGREVTPGWLFQRDRLAGLQRQAEEQIGVFVRFAADRVRTEQGAAIQAGLEHSTELVREALDRAPQVMGGFVRLGTGALQDLVGFLQDGSPLAELFAGMPVEAGQSLRKALITGVATGQNPRRIAGQVRHDLGGQLGRALTIGRTETLRSYREAVRRNYEANPDLVDGWIWTAALGARSCPACIAMHGTRHPNTERLDGHPNCRCVAVPITPSWADLGLPDIPDADPEIEPGEEWFRRQPPDVQREILGPAAWFAWRNGEVTLADFVGHRHDARWGSMRYARSLKQALGA